MTDIVVSRAELYAHGDCGGACDGPDPQPLGIGVLDVLLVDGQVVTIAARLPDRLICSHFERKHGKNAYHGQK